jgi:hypothetical protein
MGFKFNPITGNLDLVGSGSTSAENFSYTLVEENSTKTIPTGQQMLVDGHVRVLGHLLVSGELVNIGARDKEQFFYSKISEDKVVTVEQDRLLFYKQNISVNGHLRVLGDLLEVS